MTDGNTGNQVAPASVEDTAMLSNMFARAAKAIVDASEYPKQLSDLQSQIDKLQFELNAKSTHAEQLDRSLSELRQERDNLRESNHVQQVYREALSRELTDAQRTITGLTDKLHSTEQALDEAKAERDKYGMQLLSAEDQVREWRGKAEAARQKLSDMLAMFKEPEPEPEPVQTEAHHVSLCGGVETNSHLEPEPTIDLPPFLPPSAPEPAMQTEPEPMTDTRPLYIDAWEPGYEWDYLSGRYKRT